MPTAQLHIFVPDPRVETYPALIIPAPPEPMPIQYRLEEAETPEGKPVVDAILLWHNEDAARCRWCQPGTCTFIPTPVGVGTCVVRRDGRLGLALPASTLG